MGYFVFWQFMPNIHEAGYIKALSEKGIRCIVVYQEPILPSREGLGIPFPDYGLAEVVNCPKGQEIPIEALKSSEADCHFLTGIRAFDLTLRAYEILRLTNARLFLISESRDRRGLKGIARYVDSRIFEQGIRSRLDGVLAMGDLGVSWFRRVGFSPQRVHRFSYAVNPCPEIQEEAGNCTSEIAQVAFAGQFVSRKNPEILLLALGTITELNYRCHLFGSGELEKKLQAMALGLSGEVIFHGAVRNEVLRRALHKIDILVLPSRWDGWGAITNEALAAGCKCIVSDACGSSIMVGAENGAIFHAGNVDELQRELRRLIQEGPLTREKRAQIAIGGEPFSGKSVAENLLAIVEKTPGRVSSSHNMGIVYHHFPHYRQGVIDELVRRYKGEIRLVSGGNHQFDGIPAIHPPREVKWTEITNYWLGPILLQPWVVWYALTTTDFVIVFLANPNHLTTWLAASIARLRNRRVVFWGHGFLSLKHTWRDSLRDIFFSIPNAFFSYGYRSKEIALRRGFNPIDWYVGFNSLAYSRQLPFRDVRIRESIGNRNQPVKSKSLKILCLSRLTPACDYEILIRAVALAQQDECFTAELVFIGDGPSRSKLEDQASRARLKATFLGEVYDEDQLSKAIYLSDVVVSPGKIGLTAIHSLMYGTPVISHGTLDGQMPEVEAIVDGWTGLLFEKGNVASLAEKLQSFFARFPDREATRNRCFAIVDSIYNPSNQVAVLEKAITGEPADQLNKMDNLKLVFSESRN